MKKINVVLLIALILIVDQVFKIYIKTSFPLDSTRYVAGDWFQLYFVENPGMAYGWKFGGNWGKLALTLFRIIAVVFGTWYLGNIIKKGYHKGLIICAALIYAGALGNLIDSCFYGLIFDKGMLYDAQLNHYIGYEGIAQFYTRGYAGFLHGNVVDMLYFPIIEWRFPDWFPFWGGEDFVFFRPIFNIADASISSGVIAILLFQKRFLKQRNQKEEGATVETAAVVNDETQVL